MKKKLQEFRVPIPSADGESVVEEITVTVPLEWDDELQQFLLTPTALKTIEDAKARHMGLLLPKQLKELRMRLGGLKQSEIGELLQVGEKSWCRWETGKQRPSRSVNLLLRALYDGEITVEYLERVGRSRVPWGKIIHYCTRQAARRTFIRMDAAISGGDRAHRFTEENLIPYDTQLGLVA